MNAIKCPDCLRNGSCSDEKKIHNVDWVINYYRFFFTNALKRFFHFPNAQTLDKFQRRTEMVKTGAFTKSHSIPDLRFYREPKSVISIALTFIELH